MARQKVRGQGAVGVVIISNACGSSGRWQLALRSRVRRRKFEINYHALRRHWVNHVSVEARATYIAGAGVTKDRLETVVADESLALIDHYRIVRGALYTGLGAAAEVGDANSLALLAGRLHENFRDCGRLTGELQRGPLLNIQNNVQLAPKVDTAAVREHIMQMIERLHPAAENEE
jgi:hypothetical protein